MVNELDLPEAFRRRILTARAGERSERARWLRDLADVVATLAERWGLSLGEVLPLSRSYVVAATRESGEACVLKITPPAPDDDEFPAREALALRLAGPSAVRLLEVEAASGALLLARATGGSLAKVCEDDDDRATELLCSAMTGFWAPTGLDCGLPSLARLEDSFERFDRGPHGVSAGGKDLRETLAEIDSGLRDLRATAATARRVLQELLANRAPAVVVHGDLHHDNVLEDEARGWVVVDPKGFAGDAGYDTGAMLYNPFAYTEGVLDMAPLVRRRLDLMGGIVGLDADLLAAWGYVKAVLSLLWDLEDGGVLRRDDARLRVVSALRTLI